MSPLDVTDRPKLIIGCGYLGRRVAARWLASGARVAALTRLNAGALAATGVEPITGDVLDPASLRQLPEADTVLYAVGMDRGAGRSMREVYVSGLSNVLDSLPACRRFIYVSSTGVYGQTDGGWVDEDSPTEPVEESGKVVLEAERVLRERRPDAIILRFAGMYGPDRLLRRVPVMRGEPLVGDADKWLNLIHIDDGVEAVVACANPTPLASLAAPPLKREGRREDLPRNVVSGQRLDEVKIQRSKELRREMTPAEKLLWERLRGSQLPGLHFRRQQVIAGFIADFYCHAAGLVVEVDGSIHEGQAEYDAERDRILNGFGVAVLRVPNDHVLNRMAEVLRRIEAECRERTHGVFRPSPPGGGAANEVSGVGSFEHSLTLNVADDAPVARRAFYTRLAELLHAPPARFDHRPEPGAANRRVSNRKAREVLNWAPRHAGYNSGLPAAVDASSPG